MKTNPPSPTGWQRVAAEMEARATELGWKLSRFEAETGISETTRLAMRKGTPIKRASKITAACIALGWTPDSVARILAGKPPQLAGDAPVDVRQRLDLVVELVRQLLQGQNSAVERLVRIEGRLDELKPPDEPRATAADG